MDSESCTRAFSQARVYLEQIRNRVTPGGADVHGTGKRDYLVDAAKQIRLALERDVSEDYEEAFNHYKNGVDVLLNGVQGMAGQVVKGAEILGEVELGHRQTTWPRYLPDHL